jgi:hypothetical protein
LTGTREVALILDPPLVGEVRKRLEELTFPHEIRHFLARVGKRRPLQISKARFRTTCHCSNSNLSRFFKSTNSPE